MEGKFGENKIAFRFFILSKSSREHLDTFFPATQQIKHIIIVVAVFLLGMLATSPAPLRLRCSLLTTM